LVDKNIYFCLVGNGKRKQETLNNFVNAKKVKKNYKKDLSNNCYISYQNFFVENPDEIFKKLKEEIIWKKIPVIILGKEIMQPRLVSFISDIGKEMKYTNITMQGDVF
jgi:hypothetical protein